jgi:hypothetical protein
MSGAGNRSKETNMSDITTTLFPLGPIVITTNAQRTLDPAAVRDGLRRHSSGDWGNLDEDDVNQNGFALTAGGRLFSAYGTGEQRFWIITDRDRSVTTVLLPADY